MKYKLIYRFYKFIQNGFIIEKHWKKGNINEEE